jgi:AraC family transcriptional regulator, regulatory protein of adaptative response / methylphosphotriester-DNA alkyltransferase methyltransferase
LQQSSQGYRIDPAPVLRPAGERQRANWRVGILGLVRSASTCVPPVVPMQRSSTIRLRKSLFEEATEIVDREFAAELSLDDIAHRVASSRRQLQRAYAEIGGTTFRDHLTQVRMHKAAEMLSARTFTVREVAHRVGYRQPAQFAKAFRRQLGVAPSDYRANGDARPIPGRLPSESRTLRHEAFGAAAV